MQHAAITICMINQKGGCGKSSGCFHLAGYFAQQGRQVLLVDVDPQGSLSQGFLGPAVVEQLPAWQTLAGLFDDRSSFAAAETLVVQTPCPGIHLACANQELGPYNVPRPERTGMQQFALREWLEALEAQQRFEVVLMDCPPNLYQCSWNALVAADFVLIPVPPEDYGTQGLRAVHQAIAQAGTLNRRLELLGHVVCRSDRRLILHRAYEAKLRELYGSEVLATVIPEANAFKVPRSFACFLVLSRTPVGGGGTVKITLWQGIGGQRSELGQIP